MGEDVGVSEGNVREEGGGTEEAEGGEEEGGRRGARMGPVLPPLEMLEKMRRRRRRRRHPRMWQQHDGGWGRESKDKDPHGTEEWGVEITVRRADRIK